jgi:hypothetical protein
MKFEPMNPAPPVTMTFCIFLFIFLFFLCPDEREAGRRGFPGGAAMRGLAVSISVGR